MIVIPDQIVPFDSNKCSFNDNITTFESKNDNVTSTESKETASNDGITFNNTTHVHILHFLLYLTLF